MLDLLHHNIIDKNSFFLKLRYCTQVDIKLTHSKAIKEVGKEGKHGDKVREKCCLVSIGYNLRMYGQIIIVFSSKVI